jgi:ATP-dependent helicase/nuclease subunit A
MMTETLPAQTLLLQKAEHKQRLASDPAVSAWVRANAGTGKTHVLVQRILRLLLSGAAPRSILCLTFTKNAAAEMEARVLAKLGEWATASNDELYRKLSETLSRPPSQAELRTARCLFATVVDGPGGLPIMTIHGFCERVLRRYGLEAAAPPGFSVLTEDEARETLAKATALVFASAEKGPLREAIDGIVAHANERDFDRVLQAMLSKRAAIKHFLQVSNGLRPPMDRLRELVGLDADETEHDLRARALHVLDDGFIRRCADALSEGGIADQRSKARFEAIALARNERDRCAALKSAFATQQGEPRSSLMTAPIKKRFPALHERLVEAQHEFLRLDAKLAALKAVKATEALLKVTEAIFESYAAAKNERSALDFDDLIEMTLSLLSRSDAAHWVLYELDARIDHILVDEAQDTSPEQWAILEKLTSEFFAGAGTRDTQPTLFAVGDEKQSIYGFQGAVPELLAHYGMVYEGRAEEAGLPWRAVDLDLSFRTLAPVLDAVDRVCRSLPSFEPDELVPHLAFRDGSGGFVELWEPERGERAERGTVWDSDGDVEAAAHPAETLAQRIAAEIEYWLESGEVLPSCGRAAEPGDILILLRKREPMAALLQKALKQRGIPVAGADRVALLDEIAVMDLLALADCLVQPEDDLALACVLKSPMVGLTDDDLFAIAHNRETSLWRSLEKAALGGDGRFVEGFEKLSRWRQTSSTAGAFDFFARILDADQGREAFSARLGPQSLDAIDELLNLAETFDANRRGGIADFVSFARASASDVKRETEQTASEVRIMTVHAAKGLEANIVILADTCGNRSASQVPVYFLDDPTCPPPVPLWAVKGSAGLPAVRAAKRNLKEGSDRELGRLLYVAMTRARDRLYVAGFHNGSLPDDSWYRTIESALAPVLSEDRDREGRRVRRAGEHRGTDTQAFAAKSARQSEGTRWRPLLADAEAGLSVLSPSKLGQGMARSTGGRPPGARDRATAQEMGTLLHKLLEILPGIGKAYRPRTAKLIASAFKVSTGDRDKAIATALDLIETGAVPGTRAGRLAEPGLAVLLRDEDSGFQAILSGQADCIVFDGTRIEVLDYKSNARVESGHRIDEVYLVQLASYLHALERIFPGVPMEAALLDLRSRQSIIAQPAALCEAMEQVFVRLRSGS